MSDPDYGLLLDDEVRAYIAKGATFYPPNAVDLTIDGQRAVYDDMCAAFHAGHPDGVTTTDTDFGDVPCRVYEHPDMGDVTLVYYHGGGFVVGGLHSHDDVCAEICARAGLRVVSVDYGLAPEVVFPGCYNDAKAAFEGIAKAYAGPVLMCGDSAGGNLAAAVTHQLRGVILGQILIYPGLGGDQTQGSYITHANAPELTTRDMEFYKNVRAGGEPPVGDPTYAPLHDTDFTGLPPTVIVTAECDPLASDGESYRDVILAAGGQAVWFNEAGLVHGCLRARHCSTRAAAFFDRVVDAVAALSKKQWPY